MAHAGAAAHGHSRPRDVPQHRRGSAGCEQDEPMLEADLLDGSRVAGPDEGTAGDRAQLAGAVRDAEYEDAVQAVPRSDRRGDQALLYESAPHGQRRARALLLQWLRRAETHTRWRNLGLQQGVHAVHSPDLVRPADMAGPPLHLRVGHERRRPYCRQLPAPRRAACRGRGQAGGGRGTRAASDTQL